jgi:hypothetical protein
LAHTRQEEDILPIRRYKEEEEEVQVLINDDLLD